MNKQRINEIISSPGSLQYNSDLGMVNELIHSFPYFSTPYIMLSRMMHDENSIYFDKNLKISAAYIGNREILYNYIHQKAAVADLKPIEPQATAEISQKSRSEENPTVHPSQGKVHETISPIENDAVAPDLKPSGKAVSELFQYPVNDYFAQYYKKNTKPVEAKEVNAASGQEPEITLSGKKSFSGWLDALESKGEKSEQVKTSEYNISSVKDNPGVNSLIDKFINNEPKIRPQQLKMYKPEDMAKLSVVEDHQIATETLADIYLRQGLKTRAVEIFHQLILKFPEKSGYFAARIKEIQSEGSF